MTLGELAHMFREDMYMNIVSKSSNIKMGGHACDFYKYDYGVLHCNVNTIDGSITVVIR